MARSAGGLANGSRISDYVSLGVVAKAFPAERVREVLRETGKESVRERALPAHVVVYYVIALALYHAGILSRGAAVFVGGPRMAIKGRFKGASGGQIGDKPGAQQNRL